MFFKKIAPKFSGIRSKLIITLTALALIPLSIAGFYGVYYSTSILENTILRNFEFELSSKSHDIERFLKTIQRDVFLLTRSDAMKKIADLELPKHSKAFLLLREELQRTAHIISETHPFYYQVRYIDEKGFEVIRVDYGREKAADVPFYQLQYKGDRYYFTDSMKYPEGAIYVSPMDLNIERGKVEIPHKLVLRIASPVFNSLGKRKGVIIINLYARHLLQQIEKLNIAQSGTTFLVNKDGIYLANVNSKAPEDMSFTIDSAENMRKYYSADLVSRILSGKTGTFKGASEVISYSPIFTGDTISKEYWTLGIVYPKEAIFAALFNLKAVYIIIGFITLIAASMCGIWVANRITRPVLELHEGVTHISKGDLDHHIRIKTGDEIESLSRRFNDMVDELRKSRETMVMRDVTERQKLVEERLEMERQLLHADKLASVGELSAGIAHEIGNPLAAIKTVIQAMDDESPLRGEQSKYMQRILKEVDRLALFIRTFSAFANPAVGLSTGCRVEQVLNDVVFFVRKEAVKHNIAIDLEENKDVPELLIGSDHTGSYEIQLAIGTI